MSWSPVRDELAFISPLEQMRTYYGPLRLMDAQSGDVRVLSEDVVLAFFWSPDGRKIAYFTVAQAAEGVRLLLPNPTEAALAGGRVLPAGAPVFDTADFTEEEITEALEEAAAEVEEMPDEPDDGRSEQELADADEPDLWLNLWVVDVESGEETLLSTLEPVDIFVNQFLPFFDQYAKSHRIWSPDSDALVLPVMRPLPSGARMPKICVIPAVPEAGRMREVADGVMAFWSPR
jgi:TolB protein